MTAALAASWLVLALACVLLVLVLRGEREQVARVRHEVSGPLTAAHLALHGAARRGELSPTSLASLEIELRRAGMALGDLPGSGGGASMAVADVDLGDLLGRQVMTWREVARTHGVELVLRHPAAGTSTPVVRGDALRLAQALGNLLANAIEHGGDRVEVRTRRVGDRVRVEVCDDGPGLPAPVAELVRRPRAGRGARGRGLAIAAQVAAVHGGRLESAPAARGARVVLDVPAASTRPAHGIRA